MCDKNTKRKFTGTDIFTDSDEDSYVLPPAAFKKVETEGSQIVTRNTALRKMEHKTTTATEASPIYHTENLLENIIFEAVRSTSTRSNENSTEKDH